MHTRLTHADMRCRPDTGPVLACEPVGTECSRGGMQCTTGKTNMVKSIQSCHLRKDMLIGLVDELYAWAHHENYQSVIVVLRCRSDGYFIGMVLDGIGR